MPGSFTSWVNIARPVVLATLSLRGACLPMRVKSFGSFSVTVAGSGRAAAASASSPKPAVRPLGAWLTTPAMMVIDSAATFQRPAAASTSMARAVAPA